MQSAAVKALFERYGSSYRWFVTATVVLGTISTILTGTMINVAIPVIMGAFGIGQDKVHWVATGFLAAMTIAMLLNTWAVRTFGMRATYIAAMAIFLTGCVIGGTSGNENVLIFARVLQGAGAGLVQPLSMVIIYQVFPASQRGKAMGMFGLGIVLGPAMGPTFGGLIIDTFSWRYVFFLATPVAFFAAIMASLFMPTRDESEPRGDFDWAGFILISVCITSLLIGLSSGPRDGWSSLPVAALFSTCLISGVAFVLWELSTARPILQVRLFLNPQFTSAALIGLARSAGLFGTTYLVPLFVQTIQGYSPTRAGLLMIPAGLMMMVMFPLAGRLSDHMPHHIMLKAGLISFAFGAWLMTAADVQTPFFVFAVWLIVSRFGLALLMPTLNVSALSSVDESMLHQASSAFNFVRQLGGALGVSVLALTLVDRTAYYAASFAATQTEANVATTQLLREVTRIYSESGLTIDNARAGAIQFLGQGVQAQANMLAFRDTFLLVGAIFLLALIPAWFLGRHSKTDQEAHAKPNAPPPTPQKTGAPGD